MLGEYIVPVRPTIQNADEATVRLLDGLVIFWLVLWLVVGAWSGFTIWQLSGLGDTITTSGNALKSTGEALQTVGQAPVVGEGPGELGDEVVTTAEDVAGRGQEIRTQLRVLSLLLGLSIMVMPTTPVLGLYLPLRLARRRDADELRTALAERGRDTMLDRYLAERALNVLPYAAVRAISADPWQDIASGRCGALADAELERLGLRRPPGD